MSLTQRRKEIAAKLGYTPGYIPLLVKRIGVDEHASDEEIVAAAKAYMTKKDAAHAASLRLITVNGETRSPTSWSRRLDIHHSTLRWRVAYAMRRDPSLTSASAWERVISDALRGNCERYRGTKNPGRMPGLPTVRRPMVTATIHGETKTLREWAKLLDLKYGYLNAMVSYAAVDGKTAEDVILRRLHMRAA